MVHSSVKNGEKKKRCLCQKAFRRLAFLPLIILVLHTLIRIIRYFHKFPIPAFMVNFIDNPLRRKIMPPDRMALRSGVRSGDLTLEIGPGNGRYTLAAARRVGNHGKVIAVDIQPKLVARLARRALQEGAVNILGSVADVYHLPFRTGFFNSIYLNSVIGELSDPERAFLEFYRVLKPGGTLALTELLLDPDYPLAKNLKHRASRAGFHLLCTTGTFFFYTLMLSKPSTQSPVADRLQMIHRRGEVQSNYNRLSRRYDWLSASEHPFIDAGISLMDLLPGEIALEIGAGTGYGLVRLGQAVERLSSVHGIDIAPGMLKAAQAKLRKLGLYGRFTLSLADALHLPFASRSLDAIFIAFTMELFEPAGMVILLGECSRVLKPGGRLVVVSMAQGKEKSLPVQLYAWFQRRYPWIVDCRPIACRTLVCEAGFRIAKEQAMQLFGLPIDISVGIKDEKEREKP